MKGISPVVSTVILIAIAVVASLSMWYWFDNYNNKPVTLPMSGAIQITSCNGSHAFVRAVGGVPSQFDADIRDANGDLEGVLNISGTPLNASSILLVPIVSPVDSSQIITLADGLYTIIDSDYPQTQFSCS